MHPWPACHANKRQVTQHLDSCLCNTTDSYIVLSSLADLGTLIPREFIHSVNVHQVPSLGWSCARYWDTEKGDCLRVSGTQFGERNIRAGLVWPCELQGIAKGSTGCRLSIAQHLGVVFLPQVWGRVLYTYICVYIKQAWIYDRGIFELE